MTKKPNIKIGRPKKTKDEIQTSKQQILTATRSIFGANGTQGTTVAKIVDAAAISRPTFYKYFSNSEQAIDLVIEQAHQRLIIRLMHIMPTVANSQDDNISRILTILDSYLEWSKEEKEILESIHQELLVSGSPVAKHRSLTLDAMHKLLKRYFKKSGKNIPDRYIFETAAIGMEDIAYLITLKSSPSTAKLYRKQMLKLVIALFGDMEDWREAGANNFLFS